MKTAFSRFGSLLLVTATIAGCGDGLDRFPTAQVTGVVMCEGQPVPYAMVYFEPLQSGESAIVGKPGFAVADANGAFTLGTYDTTDGAVVGKHRVRVDPPAPGKNPDGWSCPCEMNSNVDVMQVDVVDGDNNFEVVLKKAKGRRAGSMTDDEREEMEDNEE